MVKMIINHLRYDAMGPLARQDFSAGGGWQVAGDG